MALSLQPRQSQKQTLTPAMWLGLNLLTLPIGELREAVKKEIESNPALEPVMPRSRIRSAAATADWLENVADDSGESLADHLMSELRMGGVEGRELELCQAIVGELDGDGRFSGSMPDLRMVTGASEAELEVARQRVMTIDPRGCGALDVAECFRAQLGSVPTERRQEVERAIGVVAEMMAGKTPSVKLSAQVLAILKKMNPYPGRLYDNRKTEFVTPDIRVDEDGDVEVDQRDVPELRVSPKYVEMAKDRSLDAETRQFAAERVKRAREFREAVVRRQETMETIAELAIGGQSEFLKRGVSALRRQTMSEVAKKAKCAVATVSRAAARKYVKTPRGTLPLRRFFVLVDQEPVEKLREILESVPADERLSDQAISERMAIAGYGMARRTVAKYRARLQGSVRKVPKLG